MEVKKGRPLAFKDEEELEEKINEYFETCEEKGRPYSMSRLAVALGVTRRTLINYGNREKYYNAIERAKALVEAYTEENLLMGRINTPGGIFCLKNNFRWSDKVEVESTNINTNSTIDLSNLSKEEIKELLKSES